ncbi:hypothetical protein [Streptomyces flavofungini]|uniref:hypothetical protein n=1 Tax=Streptomyces flavofungini TaxID=68200 RepID=UPI0034DF6359
MNAPPGAAAEGSGGGLATFLDRLHRAADAGRGIDALPVAGAAELLGLDTLTLSLLLADGQAEPVWSDPATPFGTDLADLQFTLGEGPVPDAAHSGRTAEPPARWPAFQPAALRTSARACIAQPLRPGAITLGVLTGYRHTAGPLPLQGFTRLAQVTLRLLLQTSPDTLTTRARSRPRTPAPASRSLVLQPRPAAAHGRPGGDRAPSLPRQVLRAQREESSQSR